VLKALKKSPQERDATADALPTTSSASEAQPVLARPDQLAPRIPYLQCATGGRSRCGDCFSQFWRAVLPQLWEAREPRRGTCGSRRKFLTSVLQNANPANCRDAVPDR
jgi:hypothetical protein